ncbi:DUF1405 domain-containing protein [Peribacillus kribbensis]|uniref:DUF1405 domain-containing protein n=1 Tax=Peribacillus kribbensis TaxID=356658 RepID=UPI000413845A|nr:DUF1405 domain-containing protein [Peribacillus kribbensis]
MAYLYSILANKNVLWLLFIVNLLGTAYGYYWYGYQLAETPAIFLPFVPDSPTASLFFVLVLLGFILKRNWGLFQALAIMTLFKYGIWAVAMNLFLLKVQGTLDWTGYMLMASHGAMAIEGVLYSPFYKIKKWHFAVAAIWTLHNEMIDYVFYQMPNYGVLMRYMQDIGYFTFWLSILSIFIAYALGYRMNRKTYQI